MEKRNADLGVVDEVVGILLPDPKAKVSGADGDVAAELELRIALGFEIELGSVRCNGRFST